MHSVRRVVLHLSGGYPLRELFIQLARKLVALPALPGRAAPAAVASG